MRHDEKTEPQHPLPPTVKSDVTPTSPTPTAMSRNPRRAWLAAALATFVAMASFGAATAHAAKAPKDFFGVVPQTSPTANDFQRLGQGKVGAMRIGIFWTAVDPVAPVGGFDFSTVDPLVANAAQNGVEILPYLYGTPAWVSTGLDGYSCGNECGTFAPKSDAALSAWAAFAGAVAARYGENGTFWTQFPNLPKVPIESFQIWNEPNSSVFFAPKADPKEYAKVLSAASGAIAGADPSADIVLGGMPQLGGSSKAIPGTKFLKKLYKVGGIKKQFDGVAVHPYGKQVKAVTDQVEAFRKESVKAKDKPATLWVTETGWSSKKGGHPLNVGSKGQSKRLKESFTFFKKNRKKLKIQQVDWYSYKDAPSVCAWCADSGLFTTAGSPKPSWTAFTKFTGGS